MIDDADVSAALEQQLQRVAVTPARRRGVQQRRLAVAVAYVDVVTALQARR